MNPISTYRQRYRLHQAYSQHPKLNVVADIAGNVCLTGLVVTVAWFSYTLSSYQVNLNVDNAPQTESSQVATTTGSEEAPSLLSSNIEIPAVASTATLVNAMANGAKTILPLAKRDKIYETDWIVGLPIEKFVIQLGSSADRDLVYADAIAFPTGPVAVYPFKKTASKRIVYGYSSGVYGSLDEAKRAIEAMPRKFIANGPWIRPVGALKKQIMSLSIGS